MQRGTNQLVGHVGTIKLGGVNVVDAEFDRAAQHGQGFVAVPRRTERIRPGNCMAPKPTRLTETHRVERDPYGEVSVEAWTRFRRLSRDKMVTG